MKGTEKVAVYSPWSWSCGVCVVGAMLSAALLLRGLVNRRGAGNALTLVEEVEEADSSFLKAFHPIPPCSARPAAHLTVKNSSGSNLQHMEWESKIGLAFTKNGLIYRNGTLVVPVAGQYYVYSQVYLGSRGCTQDNHLISHVIKRTPRPGSGSGPVTLVSRTVRCQSAATDIWLQTSHIGGMFMFDQGDQLFVQVSDPTYLSIDINKIFFGIFLWETLEKADGLYPSPSHIGQ
ncbi:tumor necrosis factor ligand superfamily member 15-like [Callorhinchus milii]|uniref:Tumor necrosis factor ligand superfamily member 15 n=1 Tax=Callorhinchus milii TaxID=7868 RepID=K4FUZ4_CALMI|nr:TNF superfamily member 30 [Callorhinchus milii]AFK11484.1 tumor necrosis factor ligand superfamily member 15 [Callorhinchus milii]